MSNDKSYLLNRAKGAVLSRDFSLAARLYKTLLKSEPDNVELLSQLGSVYVREGNDDRALIAYQNVIAKDPGNFSALNSLGGIYRRLGRYEDSIAVLETALSTGANENAVYYNMGHTYKLMGRYEDAADCFITVIEENPNDVLAYNHLGSIQAARGEHQKALQTYSRALQLDRNHPILHYNSAKSYIALGKLKDAKAAYENALRSHPGWVEAMDDYAHLLIRMNRFTESQDILLQANKIDSKNIPIKNSLGKVYEYLGKYDSAQKSFTDVISEDPENYSAQLGLSSVLMKQKKYEEAADVLVRMEQKHADDAEISLQYASVLVKMNRLSDVVGRLNNLYAQNPDNPELLNLVSQYALLKDEEFRIKGFFAKIARVAPEYSDHFKDIAELYFAKNEFEKAEKNVKAYLSRKSNDAEALLLLGKIYESLHQLRKAFEMYNKGLDLKDENALLSENIQLGKELQDSVQRVGELLSEQPEEKSGEDAEDPCNCKCPENEEQEEHPASNDDFNMSDENEVIEGLEEPLEFETLFEDDASPIDMYDDDVIDMSELVSDDEPIDFDTINTLDDPFSESGSKPNQYVPDEDPEFLDVDGQGYNFEEESIADEDKKPEISVKDTVKDTVKPEVPPAPTPPPYPQYPQYPSFPDQPPPQPPLSEPMKKKPEAPVQEESFEDENEVVDEAAPAIPVSEEPFIDEAELAEPEIEESDIDEPELTEPVIDEAEMDVPESDEIESDEILMPDAALEEPEESDVDETVEEQVLTNDILTDDMELPLDEDYMTEPEAYLPSDVIPQIDDVDESPISDEAMEYLEKDDNTLLTSDNEKEETDPAVNDSITDIAQNIAHKISKLETMCEKSDYVQYDDLSALLENLKELCNYLPNEKKAEFLTSLDHLRIDFLLEKMSGTPGLLCTAQSLRETKGIPDTDPELIEFTKESVQKTLEYLQELVKVLPDEKNSVIINTKIEEFLSLLH